VHSENEATVHFQTGGKVVYLPFKEGDTVYQGQTIAQLDTYPIQKQIQMALNNYKSTRDVFDQTQINQQKDIIQRSQTPAGLSGDEKYSYAQDVAKRIVEENQAMLDNSVINIELATYAQQAATLTSPIDGVITHEDVDVSNVNVTPQTSFSIADPNNLVFRANIMAQDIDFISVGQSARITLDGTNQSFGGTIEKIYPQKVALPNGQNVYQVDVTSDILNNRGKLDQSGTVLINRNQSQVVLVPVWTVVSHNYIWVEEDNKPVLKKVTIGKTHGDKVEILKGITLNEKVITDPQFIAEKNYRVL